MQSPEELNSLLFDLSKGEGWPAALNGRAADLVSRFEKNKNAQPLIQLIHDTKPIIGGAVPMALTLAFVRYLVHYFEFETS
jgi:hypothetical protein